MKNKLLLKLENTVQDYAWGSRESFAKILGMENPDKKPMAELWMGTHPKAPSVTETGTLDEVISGDPETFLGPAAASRFDGKLPFLFKVLAAGAPLSIQAHPSISQARAGFRRENRMKIDLGAFNRNYKDDNHKPEILCALTPFSAMWGFRAPGAIRDDFRSLNCEAAKTLLFPLSSATEREALMGFFMTLMGLPPELLDELVKEAVEKFADGKSIQGKWINEFSRIYPGDPGILSPLYLNILQLNPGEAVYIPAGELHAYLDGTGIELMANSDNVLRGGLTPKHVDVQELMSILSFSSRNPRLVSPLKEGEITTYQVPAEEFILRKYEMSGNRVETLIDSALIIISLEDEVTVTPGTDTNEKVSLGKGESVFVSAAAKKLIIEGSGVLYSAGIPG